MAEHSSPTILLTLLLAGGAAVLRAADPPPQPVPVAGEQGSAAGAEWVKPAPIAPQLPSTPVRWPVAKPQAAQAAPTGKAAQTAKVDPYAGLRALSFSEGAGRVQTGDGERVLKAGDLLGRDVVKAVDEGILVLQRPAAPDAPGGDARVVIRFDAQGRPTVRVYHSEDPTRVEPRPAQ
jgi:hypothetical protein